jgi:cysteine desulfurase family protein (TIGR01976 family)
MTHRDSPDLSPLRARFPSLAQTGPDGQPFAYFDGPAGTQVPAAVAEATAEYYRRANANTHGAFETSRRSQAVVDAARTAMADLLVGAPEEICFGPNMTTLTFALSRALGRTFSPGDEIIVTRLDHDANVAPWVALEEMGIVVRHCDFRLEDCTLDLDHLASLLSRRTRLVAVGHASNAVGTINPVARIAEMAHAVGALVWVDAVHSMPHMSVDVGELDADFLVCSAYKFFGPHVGILWVRREIGEGLDPYKVRPSPLTAPEKFETGTQSFEGLAGVVAAVDYLAGIGRSDHDAGSPDGLEPSGRPGELKQAMSRIAAWERPMALRILDALTAMPGVRVFGIADPARIAERCPTIACRIGDLAPREAARRLGERGIFVWDGNYYAVAVTERLGLESTGGMVRIGVVHYNTPFEVERLLTAVEQLASEAR